MVDVWHLMICPANMELYITAKNLTRKCGKFVVFPDFFYEKHTCSGIGFFAVILHITWSGPGNAGSSFECSPFVNRPLCRIMNLNIIKMIEQYGSIAFILHLV